jgi:hypothetical protein
MEEMGWIKRDPVPGPKPDKWRRGQQLPATLHTESEEKLDALAASGEEVAEGAD